MFRHRPVLDPCTVGVGAGRPQVGPLRLRPIRPTEGESPSRRERMCPVYSAPKVKWEKVRGVGKLSFDGAPRRHLGLIEHHGPQDPVAPWRHFWRPT